MIPGPLEINAQLWSCKTSRVRARLLREACPDSDFLQWFLTYLQNDFYGAMRDCFDSVLPL
jgi:hypothetical protein